MVQKKNLDLILDNLKSSTAIIAVEDYYIVYYITGSSYSVIYLLSF